MAFREGTHGGWHLAQWIAALEGRPELPGLQHFFEDEEVLLVHEAERRPEFLPDRDAHDLGPHLAAHAEPLSTALAAEDHQRARRFECSPQSGHAPLARQVDDGVVL